MQPYREKEPSSAEEQAIVRRLHRLKRADRRIVRLAAVALRLIAALLAFAVALGVTVVVAPWFVTR